MDKKTWVQDKSSPECFAPAQSTFFVKLDEWTGALAITVVWVKSWFISYTSWIIEL